MVAGKWIEEGKVMECPVCGVKFSPQIKEDGKFYKGAKQCPKCK